MMYRFLYYTFFVCIMYAEFFFQIGKMHSHAVSWFCFLNMFNIYIHVLILKEKVQSYSHIYFLLDWRVIFWLFEILVYWCSCMLGPCEKFCLPTRQSFDSFFFVDAQHISKTVLKRLTCHSV